MHILSLQRKYQKLANPSKKQKWLQGTQFDFTKKNFKSRSTSFSADRAKQIKTKATVNEDPTDKLIRELKEQNEKLRSQLSGGKIDMSDINEIAKRENLTKEGKFEAGAQVYLSATNFGYFMMKRKF